jgi:hypothetical protein
LFCSISNSRFAAASRAASSSLRKLAAASRWRASSASRARSCSSDRPLRRLAQSACDQRDTLPGTGVFRRELRGTPVIVDRAARAWFVSLAGRECAVTVRDEAFDVVATATRHNRRDNIDKPA